MHAKYVAGARWFSVEVQRVKKSNRFWWSEVSRFETVREKVSIYQLRQRLKNGAWLAENHDAVILQVEATP